MSIKERIAKAYCALAEYGGANYHELMEATFPSDRYPNAFNRATRGGPPGCSMAFNRALREMDGRRDGNMVTLPAGRVLKEQNP